MRGLRIFGVLLLVASRAAWGVIVQGGDGTQNETGLGAGAGWDYVGTVNGASGIYLGDYGGDYWVLTAGHVGGGTFTLSGNSYGMLAGSAVSLGVDIDLVLFRIEADPGLAMLNLSLSTPTNGTALTMIGYGVGREPSETRWDTSWNETSNPVTGVNRGYKWTGFQTKRWGANSVSGGGGSLSTQAFSTTFGTGRGQATSGDSGGGVFLADGTLAGVMLAVSSVVGQPASTSIFSSPAGLSTGKTYSADISAYRSQILDIVTPIPVPEPQAWMLVLLGGLLGVVVVRGRRR